MVDKFLAGMSEFDISPDLSHHRRSGIAVFHPERRLGFDVDSTVHPAPFRFELFVL
jgi:hypothetical protein